MSREYYAADLQHVHGLTYHNIEMAIHCLRVIHPIIVTVTVRYVYNMATAWLRICCIVSYS